MHEPITKIFSKQLDIKLAQFTQEELDSVQRKIKGRKAAGHNEIPQKYDRQGNSMTYCFDTVMPYITRTQLTDRQRDASPFFLRRVTSE